MQVSDIYCQELLEQIKSFGRALQYSFHCCQFLHLLLDVNKALELIMLEYGGHRVSVQVGA